MNATTFDHDEEVGRLYDQQTDELFLKRWNDQNIHWGVFLDHEADVIRRGATDITAILANATGRMNEIVTSPARILPTDIVVDAGCGVGGTAIHLAKHCGCRVTGINISQHQMEIAKSLVKSQNLDDLISIKYGNCSELLPFEDSSVDVVVNIESACHYSDRGRFLSECRRILRPGGRIVAQDLVAADGIDQREFIKPICDCWSMQFPLATPSFYRDLLHKHGFVVAELSEVDGVEPTVTLMEQGLGHMQNAARNGHELTADEHLWARQFEAMTRASHVGHLMVLRYAAWLPVPQQG